MPLIDLIKKGQETLSQIANRSPPMGDDVD